MKDFSIKDSTQGTNVKELAEDLKISETHAYRHINADGNIKISILEQMNIWCEHGDGDEILKKLAAMQGCIVYREVCRGDYNDIAVIPVIIKEFGDFVTEIGQSYADGKVTQREYDRLRKEWAECSEPVMGMFAGIEKELLK